MAQPYEPPPPAYVYQTPGAAPPPPPPQPVQKPQQKKGLFGSFMSQVDIVGKQLGKEIDYIGTKINETVDKNYSSNLLNLFANNNTIQILPRSTGKTVQILLNAEGHMILDGSGPLDPGPFNTWWTISNEGQNQVRLHNNNNYLAIVQGCVTMVPIMPGVPLGLDTKFQLHQSGPFVTLECLGDKGKYIGFLHTGQLKVPCGIRKEVDTQFSVKLLQTGYPVAQ